jgi:AraC-like DNA-binding protein
MTTISNSTSFENIIINHILESGLAWLDITQHTGVSKEEMACPTARITPEQHYKLIRLLHKQRGLDWLTLHNEFSITYLLNEDNILNLFSKSSPDYSALILNSKNLRTALNNYIKFRAVIGNINSFNLVEFGNTITMTYNHHYSEFQYSAISIINFIFVIYIVNTYLHDEKIPFSISCASSKRPTLEGICHYWQSDVSWDQLQDSIIFTTDRLDSPYARFNPVVHDILFKVVQDKNNAINESNNVKDVISSVIREKINHSCSGYDSSESIKTICEILKINKIKLSRILKEVGTSYKTIEKNVKLEESINMLQKSNKNISDISYQLGFSTQSVFNRFFSEQTNMTPLKYRKNTKTN